MIAGNSPNLRDSRRDDSIHLQVVSLRKDNLPQYIDISPFRFSLTPYFIFGNIP
jgi:hypothetical protein